MNANNQWLRDAVAVYRDDARKVPAAEQARVDRLAAQLREELAGKGVTHPGDAAGGFALGVARVQQELGRPHVLDAVIGPLLAAAIVILEAEGVR